MHRLPLNIQNCACFFFHIDKWTKYENITKFVITFYVHFKTLVYNLLRSPIIYVHI